MEQQTQNNVEVELVATALNLLDYDDVFRNPCAGRGYRSAVLDAAAMLKLATEKYGFTLEVNSDTIESAIKKVAEQRSLQIR